MPLIPNSWGKPGTTLYMPILQVLTQMDKFSLWAFFSPSWTVPDLSACHNRDVLVPSPSLWLLDWFQYVHVSFTGKPRTGHSTPGVASPMLDRGEGWPPPAGSGAPNAAHEVVGCLWHKDTLLALVHLPVLKRNLSSLLSNWPSALSCALVFLLLLLYLQQPVLLPFIFLTQPKFDEVCLSHLPLCIFKQ